MNQEKKQRLLREQIAAMLRDGKGVEILAEEVLKHGAGRKEIGKHLGLDIKQKDDSPVAPPRPIVAALIPCYKQAEPQMQSAYYAMKRASLEVCDLYEGPQLQGASVIHWARNFLLAELIKTKQPWTHVLYMDDDIVPPPDALIKLLSHKKDIVAAVCTKRIDPPHPNIMHSYEKDGNVWFRGIKYWPENELIEVGAVGTGMILISREALEKIADVYLLAQYEKDAFKISEEVENNLKEARAKHFEKTANAFWFRFLGGLSGADEYGEDVSFSLIAKRYAGITVFVDTSIQPGHIGKYAYGVQDFIAQRDLTAQMKKEGQFEIPETDSKMKISICLPTRGRPENIYRLLHSLHETCAVTPELILYLDDDDETAEKYFFDHEGVKIIRGPRKTMSDCWNDCAKEATGDILMVGADDLIFRTKGWDRMVINTFETHPDKYIFVHGDDGHWGSKFGTHGFVHRKWYETLGYLLPPYFVADYGDTWLNDIANLLGRKVYLNFLTEHMHPLWGKGELDKTHQERLQRASEANVAEVYAQLMPKLKADAEKIKIAVESTVLEPVLG